MTVMSGMADLGTFRLDMGPNRMISLRLKDLLASGPPILRNVMCPEGKKQRGMTTQGDDIYGVNCRKIKYILIGLVPA